MVLFYCLKLIKNSSTLWICWRPQAFHRSPQAYHRRLPNFRWRPQNFVGDPMLIIGHPSFSLKTPDFHWRPLDFHWRPQACQTQNTTVCSVKYIFKHLKCIFKLKKVENTIYYFYRDCKSNFKLPSMLRWQFTISRVPYTPCIPSILLDIQGSLYPLYT